MSLGVDMEFEGDLGTGMGFEGSFGTGMGSEGGLGTGMGGRLSWRKATKSAFLNLE